MSISIKDFQKNKQVKNKNYFNFILIGFFMACITLGLEYCHTNNIIHRDIKPENLVLDKKGYVKITDFGIAKKYEKDNSSETSGTPGYMAPEVMCGHNHGFAVDYFALGVIGYEFMKGVRPYVGRNRKEIKEKIMSKQVQIKKEEIPKGWSMESADAINRLLQRKPTNRLGFRGATELKEHSWFKYYAWKDLYLGKIKSPFIPKVGDNFDAKYCNKPDQIGVNTKERYYKIKESFNYKIAFNNFYYFSREENESKSYNDSSNICKNPHIVYYEENEEGTNDNDASIINRNILSNKSTDDEIYHEIKKIPKNASFTLFKLYGKNRDKKNFLMDSSLHLNKNINDEFLLNHSFKNNYFKKSKASGFGY